MMNNIDIGNYGENLAKEYLMNNGYIIEEINYRFRAGEIDIIAYDSDILVFIEVKTRNNHNYGYAFEAVDKTKQEKIINTSLNYISERSLDNIQMRFDIIEIYLKKDNKINHIKNAFI